MLALNRDERHWHTWQSLVFGHVNGEHMMIGRRSYRLTVADNINNPLQKGHASIVELQTNLRH